MALTINTNVASLNAQRNLSTSQTDLNTAMERLSSGLRINSAKDDAAGLAISDRMTSQVKGLNQAARNSNDGISLAQTAEGALQESTNILQRMRELSVQSANDTNSDSDRASLNDELSELKEELDRIADTTEFNGTALLEGSMEGEGNEATFQVGANAGEGQTISFGIDSAKGAALSSVGTTIAAPDGDQVVGGKVDDEALAEGALVVNGNEVGASDSASATDKAKAINDAVSGGDIAEAVKRFDFSEVNLEGGDISISGNVQEEGQEAVAAEQTLDFSGVELDSGDTLEISYEDSDGSGKTYTYKNETGSGTLTGSDLADEIAADFGESGFSVDHTSGETDLTISQTSGNEYEMPAMTTSGESTGEVDITVEESGQEEILAEQDLDFSSATVGDGESLVFDIDGEEHTYTNETGSELTGSDLVDDIASGSNLDVSGYDVTADGDKLNIKQQDGNGSDIEPITVSGPDQAGT
ncbi:MAG: hypothetical protein ACOC0W_02710, partial [Desulfosalsimonas sp.]